MDKPLIFNFAAAMLSIVNPIGNVPLFISYTAGERRRVQTWLAVFIALTVFLLLGSFLLVGTGLLNFFGITIAAFRIAGGILLLLTGITMVRGEQARHTQELVEKANESDFKEAQLVYGRILVPLGIPIFVGPGSISTVILYSSQAGDRTTLFSLLAILFAVSLVVFVVLLAGDYIQRLLGNLGLEIATRLLGLVLSAIGVQFILNGLANATVNWISPAIVR